MVGAILGAEPPCSISQLVSHYTVLPASVLQTWFLRSPQSIVHMCDEPLLKLIQCKSASSSFGGFESPQSFSINFSLVEQQFLLYLIMSCHHNETFQSPVTANENRLFLYGESYLLIKEANLYARQQSESNIMLTKSEGPSTSNARLTHLSRPHQRSIMHRISSR
jgi:hypothetical protein